MLGFAPIGSRALASDSQQDASGVTAAASWIEGSEAFAMAITVSAPPAGVTAAAAWTEGSEAFALVGTVDAAPVTAAASWTEGSESFAAVINVAAPGVITAAVAWMEGSEQFAMAVEVQTFYARAPAGSGYTPRAGYGQVRPADIQGYRQ